MADGSYYEGTFSNGEIDGKGMRFFSQTGSKYTGQFVKGELHGRGTMVYADGSMYEGEWYRNRKHGESQKNGIRNEYSNELPVSVYGSRSVTRYTLDE